MYLLIDAGNTFVKWALVLEDSAVAPDGSSWHAAGEIAHEELGKPDVAATLLQNLPAAHSLRRIIVSNVAGAVAKERIAAMTRAFRNASVNVEWFASKPYLAGVTNRYADFSQLGSDRFASLIGARALFPDENLLVATCGTATTIDTLTADGVFPGGMILPGLRLMMRSLSDNTAQLPFTEESLAKAVPAFATNTADAIGNGCIAAQAGAILHVATVHARHLSPLRCLLSGGAAKLVLPHLSIPAQIVDNLVLVGLHTVAIKKTGT